MTENKFGEVHARLRVIMLASAPIMTVTKDTPGSLELRTPTQDPKTGEPGWFGTVTIKKSYVAVHIIPLYDRPELADGLSPELIRRRQGKTCFNFKHVDEALFEEIALLIRNCSGP
jgi:hypothetical protein